MDHKLEFPSYEEMHKKAVKLAHLIKEKNNSLKVCPAYFDGLNEVSYKRRPEVYSLPFQFNINYLRFYNLHFESAMTN